MKIAVNTRLLIDNKLDGIGWFTYETIKLITQNHPEHEFIFLFDRKYSDEFIFGKNVTPVIVSPKARHPILYYYWFEHAVSNVLNKIKPDLFLSPDGFLSLNTAIPQLAVIHDLNFEHYPDDLPFLYQKYYRYYFPKFAKKAARIATVSEYSKKDIIDTYGISATKIDVVYNGANTFYKPINNEIKAQTKQQYTSNNNYFIFVGNLHPRKNISRLLAAFEMFKQQQSDSTKLVLVGNKMWWTSDMEKTLKQMLYKNDVIFTGRVDVEQLRNLYASSLALVYTTTFEGFGIPIIEAMNCETAVITSNTTSMPEVAGNGALLADPFSTQSIANAMQKIYTEPELRKSLIEKSKDQIHKFTWENSAQKLWKCIETLYISTKK
ncbi:MAG: glycosyltransferase family 4 protein [Bacteroidetes bacterium]|nr:glycosyltransferase family 4 protein [Bacteroidota bacterium]